jgi:hemerythrin-like domain-containing protein
MPIQIGQKTESGFNNPLGLLSDCHRRIERFLDVLVRLCAKGRGAFMTPPEIIAMEKALQYFRESAPKHTADEEESLFPRLRKASGGQAALKYMEELESDHDTADRDHGTVDLVGRRWIERGNLLDVELLEMKQVLQRLSHLYARHIEIEDKKLFPLAARALTTEMLEEIGREMAERRGAILKT